MSTQVKIPALGESITSGILAKWHVAEGALVQKGQPLYDLETDKITSEGLAEVSGVVHRIVPEGSEVAVGQVVAELEEGPATESPLPTAPAVPEVKTEAPATPPAKPAPAGESSPAVRRIAEETGLKPTDVPGTGKGGRVTKGDMLQALENKAQQPAKPEPPKPAAAPASPPAITATSAAPARKQTRTKMAPLRRRIAERLVAAQQTAAILTTFNEADMSAVMALRKKFQDDFVKRHGVKLGFMSFFVKAVVDALQAVPGLNAQLEGDEIIQNHYYDVGVAVGTDRGLVVPVVRDCDRLTFAEIEKAIADFGKRARDGKIKIEELQGGVFTISNGGVYGSMLSTPIINPPQCGILGLHAIKERPVVVDGQIVARPMMYLALSYDHRIVDGKEAVTFLVKVKEAIEDPSRLLFAL